MPNMPSSNSTPPPEIAALKKQLLDAMHRSKGDQANLAFILLDFLDTTPTGTQTELLRFVCESYDVPDFPLLTAIRGGSSARPKRYEQTWISFVRYS